MAAVKLLSPHPQDYSATIHRMLFRPIQPGTHVIVARDSATSGTTIGYHGTVIRQLAHSILAHPQRPDRWYYRVHVPALDVDIELPAAALLETDRVDPIASSDDRICQIEFDATPPPTADNIYGAYRTRGRDWVHFHFRKHDRSFDTFQLNLPMEPAKIRTRCLLYNVRCNVELDAEFVQRAIGTIVGLDAPSAEDAL